MKTTISALALGILLLTGCASTPTAAPSTAPPANEATAPPASAPETTQAPPAGPEGHSVGEAVKIDQGGGNTAQVTIVSASYVPEIGSGSFPGPAKKGGYLVLDVLWETTAGTSTPNPFYFSMKDAANRSGSLAIGTGDDLHSGSIVMGDKLAGKVAQDIGAGPWRVALTAGGGQPVFWNIPAA